MCYKWSTICTGSFGDGVRVYVFMLVPFKVETAVHVGRRSLWWLPCPFLLWAMCLVSRTPGAPNSWLRHVPRYVQSFLYKYLVSDRYVLIDTSEMSLSHLTRGIEFEPWHVKSFSGNTSLDKTDRNAIFWLVDSSVYNFVCSHFL